MTDFRLCSPRQAENTLARFFLNDRTALVSVCEEKAFKDSAFLPFGTVSVSCASATQAELTASVRNGSFEWVVPSQDEVDAALRQLLGFGPKVTPAEVSKLSASLNAMAAIGIRTGLTRPRFDAHTLTELPFRRPATVVADTSGVLQGAMDFVANYLHPMARLKVPAVLHMEVINQAERFLKTRRTPGVKKVAILVEHLLSQTGQRALLRLELRDDAEVERNLLVGDPLRSAFKEDKDPDLRELNLSVPLRGYVDRLILESARQHQSYASPGHPVFLLTSDQGLARMALAEGIPPLFFKAVTADQFFGRKLTGAMFHPFNGHVVGTSLASVLWELATAFGRVKLARETGQECIEVVAIDRDLGWSSFHSKDDLLWFREFELKQWPEENPVGHLGVAEKVRAVNGRRTSPQITTTASSTAVEASADSRPRGRAKASNQPRKSRLSEANGAGVAFYRITAQGLVALLDRLAEVTSLSDEDVGEIVGQRHPTGIAEYRRFLQSGGLIKEDRSQWQATEFLFPIRDSLRELDVRRFSTELRRVPSYDAFIRAMENSSEAGKGPVELPIPARVLPSYLAIGEITCVGAPIAETGYFATLSQPSVEEFVPMALAAYATLSSTEEWVSVGAWLEGLVRDFGVHPVVACERLQEASAAGMIDRATEGSTTDTRHDEHSLKVLRRQNGQPTVQTSHLYRGDFLIPGKSSTSLRLAPSRK